MKSCIRCKHFIVFDRAEWAEPCKSCFSTPEKIHYNDKEIENETPIHYKTGEYECIDVMLDVFGKEAVMHFAMLNAFKYIWRNEHKGHEKDLKKAKDYIKLYLELGGADND